MCKHHSANNMKRSGWSLFLIMKDQIGDEIDSLYSWSLVFKPDIQDKHLISRMQFAHQANERPSELDFVEFSFYGLLLYFSKLFIFYVFSQHSIMVVYGSNI